MNDLTCRIYHKPTKKMHECKFDELVGWSDGSVFLDPKKGLHVTLNDGRDRELIDIQLYTGTKDKNKVKVFEDDVVRMDYKGQMGYYKVSYAPDFVSFIFVDIYTKRFKFFGDFLDLDHHMNLNDVIEVVGNVWQTEEYFFLQGL